MLRIIFSCVLLLTISNSVFSQKCACNATSIDVCKPMYYLSKAEAENAAMTGVANAVVDLTSLNLKIQSQKTSKICYQYTSKSNETRIGINFFLNLFNNLNTPCKGVRKYSVVTVCDGISLPVSTITPANFYEYEIKPSTKYSICLEVTKEAECSSDSTKILSSELYMYNAGNYCEGKIGTIQVQGGISKNNNEYDLKIGDSITISANSYVLPKPTNGNTPGFGYIVFTQQPSLPFNDVSPTAISNLPGYKGITSAVLKDYNINNSSKSIAGATVLWFVPAIFDKINGEKALDSDLDRCVVLGTPIRVNYNPLNIVQCGSCATPNCPVNQVPYFENRDYNKLCNVLSSEIKNVTYYSYHLVKSDSLGGLGLVQLISATLNSPILEIKRSAVLRPLGNSCDSLSSILPNVKNANNLSSGFNPEWYSLKPLTNYVAIVKTQIPESQPYLSGCLNAYGIKQPCNQSKVTIQGKDSICENELSLFTASIRGGKWSLSSTIASISGDTLKALKSGVLTLKYDIQGLLACKNINYSATKNIVIKQSPNTGEIVGPSKLCEGELPFVYNTQLTGGVWSSSNTTVAAVAVPSNTILSGTIAPKQPGKSIISYTFNLNGCTTTKLKELTVFAKPTVPVISGSQEVCLGSNINLTTSNTGGSWLIKSGSENISFLNGIVTGKKLGSARISYIISDVNSGCSSEATKSITVNPIPSVGTLNAVLTSTGKFAVCPSTNRSITTTVAGGVWSSLNNSIAIVNNSGLVTGVAVGATSVKYTVTNTYGCSNSVFKSVIVDSKPNTPVIYGTNLMMCQNGKGYLTASLPNGKWSTIDTYLKFSTLNNGIFYQQNTIPVDNFISGVKYTVSSTNNACTSEGTKEIKLRKLAQKAVTITATSTNLVVNQQVTATATTTMTAAGAWRSFLPASLSATVSPTNNKQAIIKGLAVGTNAYVMFQSKDVSTGCTNGGWLTFNVTASQSIVDANPTTVSTTTGVDVYPNPSKGVVTFENIAGAHEISLVDMTGRTIKTVAVNADRMTVDFSGVQNGKYLVRVVGENVNEFKSIVIE